MENHFLKFLECFALNMKLDSNFKRLKCTCIFFEWFLKQILKTQQRENTQIIVMQININEMQPFQRQTLSV